MPAGFASVILWNRTWDKKNRHEREYKKLDITEKESYRWIESALKTKESLSEADTITIIGDRESDIYEIFTAVPDSRTHLLIRANIDRILTEGIKLNRSYHPHVCGPCMSLMYKQVKTGRNIQRKCH